MPMKPPMLSTVTWPTLLHYWGAAGWVYGVIGSMLFIVWAAWVFAMFNSEEIKDAPFGS